MVGKYFAHPTLGTMHVVSCAPLMSARQVQVYGGA